MQGSLPVSVLSSVPRIPLNEVPKENVSDENLMLVFSQGSAEAFAELFRRYKQPIYGFFRRRVGEPSSAEELAQETFLALVRSASRYQPRALFRTYVYAIALKILRSHQRKVAFRATFLGQRNSTPDRSHHDGTEAVLWVRRALAKLNATDREVLMLREFEQLSYAEIADVLELPINTVRSRLFRARTALRNLLEPRGSSTEEAASAAPLTIPGIFGEKGERS
jgi:RNA polymerase sigma-70 factor, ECF subfamily